MDGWIHVRCAVLCLNSWARQCSLSIKVPSRKQTKIVFFSRETIQSLYENCMNRSTTNHVAIPNVISNAMATSRTLDFVNAMNTKNRSKIHQPTDITTAEPWNIYTYIFVGKSAYDVCVPRKCRSQNKSNGHTHIIHVMRGSIGSTAHKWLEQTAWIVSN